MGQADSRQSTPQASQSISDHRLPVMPHSGLVGNEQGKMEGGFLLLAGRAGPAGSGKSTASLRRKCSSAGGGLKRLWRGEWATREVPAGPWPQEQWSLDASESPGGLAKAHWWAWGRSVWCPRARVVPEHSPLSQVTRWCWSCCWVGTTLPQLLL